VDEGKLKALLLEARVMDVSSQGHILEAFRSDLAKAGFITSATLRWKEHDAMVRLAGEVILIHTPPTKSKKRVMFLTLEDEEGLFDLTVFEDVQKRCARNILSNPVLLIEGQVNRFGIREVSVVVERVWPVKELYQGKIGNGR